MAKKTANQGWIKQLSKAPAKPGVAVGSTKQFDYKKPISKVDKIQNMAVNSRSREMRTAKPDKSTNFATEQVSAKQSHKGSK